MRALLQEIKTILEYERALFGSLVPLTEERPAQDAVDQGPPSATSSSPAVDSEAMSTPDIVGNTLRPDGEHAPSPYQRIHRLIPQNSPLYAMKTLEEAEAYVRDTILIPLDETRKNCVFGVGNPAADIMVIGEAPGADEDEQGEPFVGRAGQLLNKILEAVQFTRNEVYIANILKSRPPNNRNPLPEEVEAHVPILYKQIALIQPKLILCVGKTSGTTLLNKQTTLGALRQTFHDLHGLPVLVTYHPAALLRNPNWKRPTWEDVQLLRKRYDELVDAAEVA